MLHGVYVVLSTCTNSKPAPMPGEPDSLTSLPEAQRSLRRPRRRCAQRRRSMEARPVEITKQPQRVRESSANGLRTESILARRCDIHAPLRKRAGGNPPTRGGALTHAARVCAREVGLVTSELKFVAVLETKRSVLCRKRLEFGLPCRWWSLMPKQQHSWSNLKEQIFRRHAVETELFSAVFLQPKFKKINIIIRHLSEVCARELCCHLHRKGVCSRC